MDMLQLVDLGPLMPEIFLCVTAIILLMFGVFSGDKSARGVAGLAIFALVGTMFMVCVSDGGDVQNFGFMFISNSFTVFAKKLILAGSILSLIFSLNWLTRPENMRFEFAVLVLFAALGMMLMVSANDFLGLYMGLELSSLSLYVLAAFSRDDAKSSEAGLKYFILGSLASGMLLFGISLVYGYTGSTQFAMLNSVLGDATQAVFPYGVIIGIVMVVIGFCFKVSAAPFHMWTPDVYEGAPTPVVAFFATAPKIAAVFLLARVLTGPFANMAEHWQQVIVFVSLASMLVGAFGGLTQKSIKRLLAYSSIGHVGYALIGLAAVSEAGVQGLVIYMSLYLFMSAGAFGLVLLMQRKGEYLEKIEDLSGISARHPYMAAGLAVLMFSMAGIPPLAGFFGKMYVIMAAIDAGLIALVVIGLLTSVVACFYYLKIVKVMYFDEPAEEFDAEVSGFMKAAIAICVLVSVFFVLKPALLLVPAQVAVQALL